MKKLLIISVIIISSSLYCLILDRFRSLCVWGGLLKLNQSQLLFSQSLFTSISYLQSWHLISELDKKRKRQRNSKNTNANPVKIIIGPNILTGRGECLLSPGFARSDQAFQFCSVGSDALLRSQAIFIYSSVHFAAFDSTLHCNTFSNQLKHLLFKDFFAYLLKTWKPVSFVISKISSCAGLVPVLCPPSLIRSIVISLVFNIELWAKMDC